MSLTKYHPQTSSLYGSTKLLDPERCPVMVQHDYARMMTGVAQCTRKPRTDRVRPVYPQGMRGEEPEQLPVCGVHAYVLDKAERRDTARRDAERVAADRKAATIMLIGELASWGIAAQLHYDSIRHEYTDKVVVKPEQVLDALKAMS